MVEGNTNPVTKLPNGMNLAGMIMGIISMILFYIPILSFICFGLGIAAIIVSAKGMKAANEGRAGAKGMGIAGLITGILGTLLSLVYSIFWIWWIVEYGRYF